MSDTWSEDVDNVTTVNIVACTCRYDLPDGLEKMLRDDWESRESFRENLEGKLFVSATTVMIIGLHGFTFSPQSCILLVQRQFPHLEAEAIQGQYPQFPKEMEKVLTIRFNEPQEQPVCTSLYMYTLLKVGFYLYCWDPKGEGRILP